MGFAHSTARVCRDPGVRESGQIAISASLREIVKVDA